MRASFYACGFDLPVYFLAAIEAIRRREPDECDYQKYLDEVLRESAVLPLPWQPSVRHILKPAERSTYLDLLSARFGSDSASLDPNYKLFAKLRGGARADLLKRMKTQRQIEVQRHSAQLALSEDHTEQALIRGVITMGERFGFFAERAFKVGNEELTLKHHSNRASLKIVDLAALRMHGSVFVQYFFHQAPRKPFALDSFVPGGHEYSYGDNTPQGVLFSFYAQCRFAVELDIALSRPSNDSSATRRQY